jgi:uncharacterized protein
MNPKRDLNVTPSKIALIRIITVLCCGAISGLSIAAGFDCGKATTGIEKTICSDEVLSGLDSQLQETYLLALGDASFSKKAGVKGAQEEWVSNVRNQCGNINCLRAAYTARVDILASIKTTAANAHYLPSGSDAKRPTANFQQQLNHDGFPGDLRECKRIVKLDNKASPDEPMLSAGKDTSYGAICSFNNRLVMICDDTMVGKMTLKLTGFTVNGPALADFTQMNCPVGG